MLARRKHYSYTALPAWRLVGCMNVSNDGLTKFSYCARIPMTVGRGRRAQVLKPRCGCWSGFYSLSCTILYNGRTDRLELYLESCSTCDCRCSCECRAAAKYNNNGEFATKYRAGIITVSLRDLDPATPCHVVCGGRAECRPRRRRTPWVCTGWEGLGAGLGTATSKQGKGVDECEELGG